jgi:hypothetical protein
MEDIYSSEMSIDVQLNKWQYIPEYRTLPNRCSCQKFFIYFQLSIDYLYVISLTIPKFWLHQNVTLE